MAKMHFHYHPYTERCGFLKAKKNYKHEYAVPKMNEKKPGEDRVMEKKKQSRGLCSALLVLLLLFVPGFVQSDSDDFGFKPVRRKLKYVEEFYRLYTENHMGSTASVHRNLVYLQYALNSPYIHPIQALCKIKTRDEHAKYRLLLRTRIAFLLAKGFVKLGYRFDKKDINYFNMEFKKDLRESFDIARHYYKEAIVYWHEARRVAARVMEGEHRRLRLEGALIEDIRDETARIYYGDINYRKTIDFRMRELDRKLRKLETMSRRR